MRGGSSRQWCGPDKTLISFYQGVLGQVGVFLGMAIFLETIRVAAINL